MFSPIPSWHVHLVPHLPRAPGLWFEACPRFEVICFGLEAFEVRSLECQEPRLEVTELRAVRRLHETGPLLRIH